MTAPTPGLDPAYFADRSWADRVADWLAGAQARPFAVADERVVRQVVSDPEAGARVVINMGARALVALLTGERYRNLYEHPLVGGERRAPSPERVKVDGALGLTGADVYFAALAVGGTGVAYYGEYCAVLDLSDVDPEPRLFDRDSYDILFPPLSDSVDLPELVSALSGDWGQRHDMLVLTVLPGLPTGNRIVTSGTVAQAVLRDQQFVEVHVRPSRVDGEPGGFGVDDIEELRESPDTLTATAWLRHRADSGHHLSPIEQKVLEDREAVEELLAKSSVRRRVVTQHDRGYQWA